MDYETMMQGMHDAIPFNRHIGLEYVEMTHGTALVRLPERQEGSNHLGTQHAGALFTAAEAASGAAFVAAFAERIAEIVPVAASARIDYRKLAKGPIDATAKLDGLDQIVATLDSEGKVEFPIDIQLTDADGQLVANATVDWHVRKKKPSA